MSALVKIENMPSEYSQDKLELLKNTVCKGATNDEFQLFLHVCKKTGLDPFMKQIYSIPRGTTRTIQTSIDGLRLIAERTGRYSPGKESVYTYGEKKELIAATSYIKKMTSDGTWHEIASTAMFSEFSPGSTFWKKMPHVMLAKCAEASALRKAFPAEMSGVYSDEEMEQANKPNVQEEEVQGLIIPIEDPEIAITKFLSNYESENREMMKSYIKKYAAHYKQSITDSLNDYNDKEKFLKDFNLWKNQKPKKK